ncbi:STN domain-containing protein [Pollutimonas bauzanensis]|uniref:STN domain-containing protein n=1 Tax=Pollutimonas bauzanensis TaxID=658167 RepID=UPI000934DC3F|nr:STN domain-containing protein [Pollutimonas bauzanensis]
MFWLAAHEFSLYFIRVFLSVARVRAVAALIVVLSTGIAGAMVTVHAQEAPPDRSAGAPLAPSSGTFDFDIPSLPLAEALKRYGGLTGYSVFYETSVVAGKRSSLVRGHHTAEAALKQLLGDTALSARFVNRRSIMLMARPAPASPSADTSLPSVAQRRYDGLLQRQITQALCANPAIAAGRYRIALRFSVSGDQRLHQIRVRVAERPDLEPALRAALADLPVGAPPPEMAQPVVMIVSPEAARRYGACPP